MAHEEEILSLEKKNHGEGHFLIFEELSQVNGGLQTSSILF